MRDRIHNGGAYGRTAFVAINKTATAAGAGDNTEVDGAWVNRRSDDYGLPMSAKLIISYRALLTALETLSFAVQFRDAITAGGGGAEDYESAAAMTVAATGESGGSIEEDTFEVDIDISHAREFLQAQITPDLSAGSTDTVEWAAVIEFYGYDRVPVSKSAVALGSPL